MSALSDAALAALNSLIVEDTSLETQVTDLQGQLATAAQDKADALTALKQQFGSYLASRETGDTSADTAFLASLP